METFLELSQVPEVLRIGYNGKKFKAIVTTSMTVPGYAGFWEGGSRTVYSMLELATGNSVPLSDTTMSTPWDKTRVDRHVEIEPGYVVIRHDISSGKDMGITFFVHPDNAAKLLPSPSVELSAVEKIVLEATCRYKASYNGKDRYAIAKDHSHWYDDNAELFPSRNDWDDAKHSLIAKGLLDKRGAVTVAGRNARSK